MQKDIREYVIYKITNLINGKIYIGLSGDYETRKKNHLRQSKIDDTPLYRSMRKNGVDNFKFEIIEKCKNSCEMFEREVYWIKELNSVNTKIGYNIKSGGEGGGNHENESPEQREKRIKETHKRPPNLNREYKNTFKSGITFIFQIMFNKKRYAPSGSYRTETEAAWAADLFIRTNFPDEDIYLNFPNGKTKELIREQLASKKLKEVVKYVYYDVKEYRGKHYCKGRDIISEKDINIGFGTYEICKQKLDKFIIENKAIRSGRRNLTVTQKNWEELHGSIYDLVSAEELEQAYKEQVGKFE